MRKFEFRLKKVLEIKQKLREIKKIELSKKAQEYNKEVMKLNDLKDRKETTIKEMKEKVASGDFSMIDFYDKYINTNNKLQSFQLENIRLKEEPFKKALSEYLQKDREVKALENYKERLYSDYVKGVINEEQKMIDDIVGGRRNEKSVSY
jgi:flagellar export protein FliJ